MLDLIVYTYWYTVDTILYYTHAADMSTVDMNMLKLSLNQVVHVYNGIIFASLNNRGKTQTMYYKSKLKCVSLCYHVYH